MTTEISRDPLLRREEFADILTTPEAQLIIVACFSTAGWGMDLAERRLLTVLDAAFAAGRASALGVDSELRLLEALDTLPWTEWLHDLDGTQHYVTHETGYDGDDLEGLECITGVEGHEEDATTLKREIAAALATDSGPDSIDAELLRKAVADLHRWDVSQGWGKFNTILGRIDDHLAAALVPVEAKKGAPDAE